MKRLKAALRAFARAFGEKPAAAPLDPAQAALLEDSKQLKKEAEERAAGYPSFQSRRRHISDWREYTRNLIEHAPDAFQVVRTRATADGKIIFDAAPKAAKMALMDSGYSPGLLKDFDNGFSGGVSNTQLQWFALQSFIGWQLCAILSQHWLISKACSTPARDAIRNGWKIKFSGKYANESIIDEQLTFYDRKHKIAHHCRELVRRMKIFGIRIAMPIIDYDDPDALEKPFNIDGVKPGSYKGWTQIDPYWIIPVLDATSTKPGDKNFYEPMWWICNGKRIHRTHLIICRGPEVPDLLKPVYYFGGLPLTQLLYERVYAAESVANEAPRVAAAMRTQVLQTNLSALAKDWERSRDVLQNMAEQQNNFGTRIIGMQDKFEQHNTALADFDNLTMTQYQLVAAISDMPATKLLGTSPKGFQATGEHEIDTYNQTLESIQSIDQQPLIERHTLLAWQSDIRPLLKDDAKCPDYVVEFNPLDVMTAKEEAELDQIKVNTLKAGVDGAMWDGLDARDILRKDEESMFHGMSADVVPSDAPEGAENEGAKDEAPDGIQYGTKHDSLAAMTGRETQALLRVVRKHAVGELSETQARVLLRPYGLPDGEISSLLAVEHGNGKAPTASA